MQQALARAVVPALQIAVISVGGGLAFCALSYSGGFWNRLGQHAADTVHKARTAAAERVSALKEAV